MGNYCIDAVFHNVSSIMKNSHDSPYKEMKLRLKIIVIIFSIATLMVVGLGYSVYSSTHNALQTSISENQLSLAKEVMGIIDRTLRERVLDIQTLSTSQLVSRYVANPKKNSGLRKTLEQEMHNRLTLTGPWNVLHVMDKTGKILLATDDDSAAGKNFIEDTPQGADAFLKALSGDAYSSDVIISTETHKPTVFFSSPIRDDTVAGDPIVGVIVGDYSWETIEKIISNAARGAYIVDLLSKDGIVLAHSSSSVVQQGYSTHKSRLYSKEAKSVIMKGLNGGHMALVSHAPERGYLNYKGKGWIVVIETPVGVAFAPANYASAEVVVFVAVSMVFGAFVLTLFLDLIIVRPIIRLASTAQEITNGNLNARAEISSNDELGKLATSFNSMTDSLIEINEKNRAVIEILPEPMFILDKEGKIMSANKAVRDTTGLSEAELKGKSVNDFLKRTNTSRIQSTHVSGKYGETVRYIPESHKSSNGNKE